MKGSRLYAVLDDDDDANVYDESTVVNMLLLLLLVVIYWCVYVCVELSRGWRIKQGEYWRRSQAQQR